MTFSTTCLRMAAFVALQFAFLGSSVHAMPIQFTHSGYGNGSLDGVSFSGQFTIRAAADTRDRIAFGTGAFSLDHAIANIDIEGLGVFEFLTATRTYVNNRIRSVGFGRAGGADLFNGPSGASSFGDWDMLSSIDHTAGAGSLVQWGLLPVRTTGGALHFDTRAAMRSGFSAVVATPVPAAASVWLLILACLPLFLRQLFSQHS